MAEFDLKVLWAVSHLSLVNLISFGDMRMYLCHRLYHILPPFGE